MADMYAGYQGATITDDNLGLVHWNAAEQIYEKRTGYSNDNGNMWYSLDGAQGGYDLPKAWFNDKYNAMTGKLSTDRTWMFVAALAVIAVIAFIIYRKK